VVVGAAVVGLAVVGAAVEGLGVVGATVLDDLVGAAVGGVVGCVLLDLLTAC